MDNLTHSLFGALIGQTGLKRKTGLAMPALIIGANIPDIDGVCMVYGTESLVMRRGLTHGPIAWVVLPLILAAGLWWFDRWQERRGRRPATRQAVHFGWLLALCFAATMTHPALDWLNVYGIRFLAPFSQQWYYGDVLFIVDIWLWLGMALGLWMSLRREKSPKGRWHRPAIAALALSVVYIAANGAISQAAIAANSITMKGPNFRYRGQIETVIASPVPFNPLARQVIAGRHNQWFMGEINEIGPFRPLAPITDQRCAWPDTKRLRRTNAQLDAFLFWSRTPFAERGEGGSVVIRDARFYRQSTRDPFSVSLPSTPCRPISDTEH